MEVNEVKKKRNVFKILGIILITILVLLILYFCVLYFIVFSPKKTFNRFFNKTFDTFNLIVDKLSVDEAKTSINKGNIKIDTNIEKYNGLKEYEIEYDYETNRVKNTSITTLKFSDGEEDLDTTFYLEDNNLYIDFPYIMQTEIKIPLEDYGYSVKSYNYKKDSADYIINIIKTSFINNINKNQLKNSISEFHIKSTYKINKEEFGNLLEIIINDLKKDEKAMKIIKDENILQEYKDKIISKINKYEYIEINLYTSFLFSLDKITINTKSSNITLILDDDNELSINTNNKEVLKSTFNEKQIKTTLNRKSKVIETDLKIDTSKDELNLEGNLNYKKENDEYIKLDVSIGALLNQDINTFDTTQAKSFNSFTSTDLKSVYKIIDMINTYIEAFTGSKDHNINLKK